MRRFCSAPAWAESSLRLQPERGPWAKCWTVFQKDVRKLLTLWALFILQSLCTSRGNKYSCAAFVCSAQTHVTLFFLEWARRTSLFSGICREIRTNFHQRIAEKMQNLTKKMKRSEIQLFIREKMLTIFGWNFEIRERCKGVHCVDLGESFPTSMYLQKSASIQPRTSPSKFGGKIQFNIHFTP